MIIKPLGLAVNVTSASTVNNARLVRAYAAADAEVTIANDSANTGSFIMSSGSVEIIEKGATDTITSNTTLSCTPIAFNVS